MLPISHQPKPSASETTNPAPINMLVRSAVAGTVESLRSSVASAPIPWAARIRSAKSPMSSGPVGSGRTATLATVTTMRGISTAITLVTSAPISRTSARRCSLGRTRSAPTTPTTQINPIATNANGHGVLGR